jgi:hypothetical protein
MNKFIFYIFLIFLALVVTLTGVYYLNLGNIKQTPALSDSRVSENLNQDQKLQEQGSDSNLSNQNAQANSVLELEKESLPLNFTDTELIDLEKELKSLDLSSENDIE